MMSTFGLHPFDIAEMPREQRFTNLKYVSIREGNLYVSGERQVVNVLRLDAGNVEYVGTNNGEWGGRLEAIENGVTTELMKGNIVHLLRVGKGLYIFEGLAHLSLRQGSIRYIPDIHNPEVPDFVATLPDAPKLVYLDDARPEFLRFVIVGSMSVMSLDHEYKNLNILYWDAFWSIWLTPTSIVRMEDRYFIGFPHGVAAMPAPFGPTSTHCKSNCSEVEFFVDPDF